MAQAETTLSEDAQRTVDEAAKVDEAANAAPAPAKATARDRATIKARKAELGRQHDVVEAVAGADLESLGGPLLEPGLGR